MAKVITQDTFDAVVEENIIEFSMDPSEAKEETVKQFEAQGVNLANIIKDLSINEKTGKPKINEAIDSLKAHVSQESVLDLNALLEQLDILYTECEKSVPHRVLAVKSGGNELIVTILEKEFSQTNPNKTIILKSINCGIALINKQPDIFGAEALAIIIQILNKEQSDEILCGVLEWLSKACIMHEINRQNIMNADILDHLLPLVATKNPKVISELCSVFRYLILDDDIRVEFGKAHEHAKKIADQVLIDLTKLLNEFKEINVLCDLLLTIASLIVRHELCIVVEDAGGLKYLFKLLSDFADSLNIAREALKLIKALAGHDTVKVHIIEHGAAPIIHCILDKHKVNENLAKIALACVSTLALRVKQNSEAFFETGIAETIVDTMKLHPKSKQVQRNAAWAIRNMVSRSREQCETFLSFGAEDVLNAAMKEHPSINQDIKSALRDLGAKVELKEEWTGKSEKKIAND